MRKCMRSMVTKICIFCCQKGHNIQYDEFNLFLVQTQNNYMINIVFPLLSPVPAKFIGSLCEKQSTG